MEGGREGRERKGDGGGKGIRSEVWREKWREGEREGDRQVLINQQSTLLTTCPFGDSSCT